PLGRELPLMLAVMIFVLLLLWDGALGRFDASLLLLALAAVLYGLLLIVRAPTATEPDPLGREFAQELPPDAPAGRAWLRLALGLAGLLVGSRML
ncbi:MAG: calcium/sodium antiporter, partial [Gammaproteobacteria bacterium]|nr:calcium/sodium antiporter [Gammaproteobacteria bacterium]NIR83819.1 calcium/sodium antiporter [Gammaproteobacteria bacterium]NIV73426.1 calcium/sodium antiporter [Gammaproteobacteria bacterium]